VLLALPLMTRAIEYSPQYARREGGEVSRDFTSKPLLPLTLGRVRVRVRVGARVGVRVRVSTRDEGEVKGKGLSKP
jgi:hypothetical protein